MFQRNLIVSVVIVIVAMAVGADELAPPPALAESSEVSVRLTFSNPTPATEIYKAVGETAGVEIVFDPRFNGRPLTIDIETSTTSAALDLVSAAAGDLWVPTAGNAVIVADDTPQNHRQYEPIIMRTFVLEDGNVREADKLLRSIVNVRNMTVNEALRTVTVREAAGKMPIIERLIASVDHAPGEVDARIELLRLSETSNGNPPPTRFEADEYANWRRTSRSKVLADSSLSLLGSRHGNLHLGAIQESDLGLDLRLDGRVHPESRSVSLEVRAVLASSNPESPSNGTDRPARGRIESSARVSSGSTLLLRIPGSDPGGIAIAITPTIVRSPEFDPAELDAVWVGTETRIQAAR
jgi:type II secretory pathway component GspD/PulD (secretin)